MQVLCYSSLSIGWFKINLAYFAEHHLHKPGRRERRCWNVLHAEPCICWCGPCASCTMYRVHSGSCAAFSMACTTVHWRCNFANHKSQVNLISKVEAESFFLFKCRGVGSPGGSPGFYSLYESMSPNTVWDVLETSQSCFCTVYTGCLQPPTDRLVKALYHKFS